MSALPQLSACRVSSAEEHLWLQDRSLADQAHWCREYAKVNAVALRKILEQHDMMLRNGAGQELLQVTFVTFMLLAKAC